MSALHATLPALAAGDQSLAAVMVLTSAKNVAELGSREENWHFSRFLRTPGEKAPRIRPDGLDCGGERESSSLALGPRAQGCG